MKKFINVTTIVIMLCMLATMACGCSGKNNEEEIADESIVAEETAEAEETSAEAGEETTAATAGETAAATVEITTVATAATAAATTEATTAATTSAAIDTMPITDEMAYDAIQNRCILDNPSLVDPDSAEGSAYWTVESSSETQVVVLFRSYTGAEMRYYIDRATGDTYVTELVPGIIDEEQRTGETFNARDHIAPEIYR